MNDPDPRNRAKSKTVDFSRAEKHLTHDIFPVHHALYIDTFFTDAGSCRNPNRTATRTGNTMPHSVARDITLFERVSAFKVESENSCDRAQSSCQTDHEERCFGQ